MPNSKHTPSRQDDELLQAIMSNTTNTNVLLAGGMAAFTVDLLVYPLDTIKTRLQSQDIKQYAPSGTANRSRAFALRGLYQGVGSVIIATLPAAGLFFTVYESAKSLLATLPLAQPITHSLASGTAELSSCLILTPAEVIKQNAQMLRRQPNSRHRGTSIQAFRMLLDAEGGIGRRLWGGYTALAARNLPFTGLQFPIFEALRARIWTWRGRGSTRKPQGGVEPGQSLLETGLVTGCSAAGAGSVAALVTTPTDVVKTRMMLLQPGEKHASPADKAQKGRRMSGWEVTKLVYGERGIRGLFRGGMIRAVWTALGSGLYLGTYETAKVWLTNDEKGEKQL